MQGCLLHSGFMVAEKCEKSVTEGGQQFTLYEVAQAGSCLKVSLRCDYVYQSMTKPADIREKARNGQSFLTTGLAPGHIQANLIVLPSSVALDFELLCARNPVQCPLLGKSTVPGDPHMFTPTSLFNHSTAGITKKVDICHDIPLYNIYETGVKTTSKTNIENEWSDDSVAFLIGCSYSFEHALIRAGLPPRQIQQGCNVPMYRTDVKLFPSGIFVGGTMVVSMRPYHRGDIEKVRSITRLYVKTHGEPVAWGWDAVHQLGIHDIACPDFGDAVKIGPDEVPVFWGCGVTPQVAVMAAGDKIPGKVMAHAPGHMMILDITEMELFESH